jgi:hypothetical protein
MYWISRMAACLEGSFSPSLVCTTRRKNQRIELANLQPIAIGILQGKCDMNLTYKSGGRVMLAIVLALSLTFALMGAAQAKEEDRENLPRVATSGNIQVEILSPTHDGPHAGSDITFRFKVTDATGKPLDGVKLSFTATRDYSGQVKKEHNSPRDPVVGPYQFTPTGTPGEYTVVANFWHNGHWQISVEGEDLSSNLRFTQSIASDPNDGTGFSWDWLIWPGMLLIALGIVFFIGTKGDKFAVPEEEVKGYRAVSSAGR